MKSNTALFQEIASVYGTPCYVYFEEILENNFLNFQRVFDVGSAHKIHYAVKANSNLAVLQLLARMGSGFDIVSGGELLRVLKAGGNPQKIVFSGVGKQNWEIQQALNHSIGCFNIESLHELHQIQELAKKSNKIAPIAFRVNPDISVETHPYITTGLKQNKFGIHHSQIMESYRAAQKCSHINIIGISCHLGSQIFSEKPYIDSLEKLLLIKNQLESAGIILSHIDIGGGFGIDHEKKFEFAKLFHTLKSMTDVPLSIEPGRSIVANAGVLLTKVLSVKEGIEKKFVIVDAAMNDLMRPALYSAYHDIRSIGLQDASKAFTCDIVGPICETGDFLAKERKLYTAENDLLMIDMAGAYGFCMSSNYNSRPRAAEVLVRKNSDLVLIRARETLENIMELEKCLD